MCSTASGSKLHTFGLLSGAFRPDDQICVLRSYLRQRAMLVRYASEQKALEQMNVKLTQVVTDITGVTGMGIIRAILASKTKAADRRYRSRASRSLDAAILVSMRVFTSFVSLAWISRRLTASKPIRR